MLLCQLSPTFQQEDPPQSNINWEESANEIPQPLLLSCPSWINTMKNLHNATRQLPEVDITNLYGEQHKAYSIISANCAENATIPHQSPLRMLILGTAGTGKSYLIRALAKLLGNKCLLSATTGMASFLIGGLTLHSGLALPVQGHNKTDLSGNSLAKLQLKLANKY